MKTLLWIAAAVLALGSTHVACGQTDINTCPDPTMPCDLPDAGSDAPGDAGAGG